MGWTIKFDSDVEKDLKKLGQPAQKQIMNYLRNRIASSPDPRAFGKPLRGNLSGLWRYRIQNHRIICHIDDEEVVVLVLKVGHRKNVYH